MRYRLMATYRGAPYEAGIGPADGEVVLFAACPPPEELGFEPATGHWRKELKLSDVQAVWESRPVGTFRGDRCIVLDDLGDRLHIGYLGHDAYRAEQLGYWQVDRGVFELVAGRDEVTDIIEERTDYPDKPGSSSSASYPAPPRPADPGSGPAGPSYPPPASQVTSEYPTMGGRPEPGRPSPLDALDSGVTVPVPPAGPPLPLEAEAMRAASAASRRDQADPGAGPSTGVIPAVESVLAASPSATGPSAGAPSTATQSGVSPAARPVPPGEAPGSAVLHAAPVSSSAPASSAAPLASAAPETPAVPAGVATAPARPGTPAGRTTTVPATGTFSAGPSGRDTTAHGVALADPGMEGTVAGGPALPASAGPGPAFPGPAFPSSGVSAGLAGPAAPPRATPPAPPARTAPPPRSTHPTGAPAPSRTAAPARPAAPPSPLSPASAADPASASAGSPRRRRAARRRMATERIFGELASLAAIPAASYSVGEEVEGAMCLLETADGFEVFSSAGGSRHEIRVFSDEESACFYLFGVLAADAVRTGALVPGPSRVPVAAVAADVLLQR